MSDEKHPERRAGQRWRLTVLATGTQREGTLRRALPERNGDWSCGEAESGFGAACWLVPDLFAMTLLADVPATPQPSAPVVACKAPEWCGFMAGDTADPRRRRWLNQPELGLPAGDRRVCSHACAAAVELPPLATQPTEAKLDWYYKPRCCEAKLGPFANSEESNAAGRAHENSCAERAHLAQPAEQLKPTKGPVCSVKLYPHNDAAPVIMRTWSKRLGPTPTCEPCFLSLEETAFKATVGTGKPYTGPERLPRPRLAHVAGMHDDDLVGGAR